MMLLSPKILYLVMGCLYISSCMGAEKYVVDGFVAICYFTLVSLDESKGP